MIRRLLTAPLSSDDIGDALVIGVCLLVVAIYAFGGIGP